MFQVLYKICLCAMLAAFLFGQSGCQRKILTARSEALDLNYLASFHVRAPDPRVEYGYCGQQIIVQWDLPKEIFCRPDLKLMLSMVTTKHCLEKVVVPIRKACGYYIYRQVNSNILEKGAVLTYKAEIFSGSQLLKCWKQQGWVEWINLDVRNSDLKS